MMKANRSIPAAAVVPVLIYPDVRAAVDWLGAAFGFVERVQIEIGENHRSQTQRGRGSDHRRRRASRSSAAAAG